MPIEWNASWPAGRKPTVEGAIDRIEKMLFKAYLAVKSVEREQGTRAVYLQHFANLDHLDRTTDVILKMYERITKANQDTVMHYVPDAAEFNKLGVGQLPAGIDMRDVEAFVTQNGIAPATPLNVYIAPAFFTGDVYIPRDPNQRSGTGTILHELSHGVANTLDHAYAWDNRTYPTLTPEQRANNADTYRVYCQTFDML